MRYYLDTSIWRDLFEDRNEPIFPKSDRAKMLLQKIIYESGSIACSSIVLQELKDFGYYFQDVKEYLDQFRRILLFPKETYSQFGKASDLSRKRNIPRNDALHVLLAREMNAILVSRDAHFFLLRDIVIVKTPEDILFS